MININVLRAYLACLSVAGSLLAHAFETVQVANGVYALVGDLAFRSCNAPAVAEEIFQTELK